MWLLRLFAESLKLNQIDDFWINGMTRHRSAPVYHPLPGVLLSQWEECAGALFGPGVQIMSDRVAVGVAARCLH